MSTLHDSEMENDQIEIQKLANQIITEWFGPIDKVTFHKKEKNL